MMKTMEETIEGKRKPSSRRIGMIKDLLEKERYGDLKRMVDD